jgi:hypothetical protein
VRVFHSYFSICLYISRYFNNLVEEMNYEIRGLAFDPRLEEGSKRQSKASGLAEKEKTAQDLGHPLISAMAKRMTATSPQKLAAYFHGLCL